MGKFKPLFLTALFLVLAACGQSAGPVATDPAAPQASPETEQEPDAPSAGTAPAGLTAILQQGRNDQLVFESDSLQLQLPPDFKGQMGQQINLLLRPKHLHLKSIESKEPDESLGVVGEITFVTLLGLSIEYEVKLESGAQLRIETARSRDQAPLSEGSRVWVTPKDSARFLTIPI